MQINAVAAARLLWWKTIHDVDQEDIYHVDEQDGQDRSFDVVRVDYINLDSVKSVIFIKVESSTSQR